MGKCSHVNILLGQNGAEALRARYGDLTPEQFAKKLGISRATLTRLESASQNTTIVTLAQIAKALKCDVGGLFTKTS